MGYYEELSLVGFRHYRTGCTVSRCKRSDIRGDSDSACTFRGMGAEWVWKLRGDDIPAHILSA